MSNALHFDHPDYAEVSNKEWLVTNGIGGFASSTLCGANTRRYHGLLVAAFNPPTDRRVLVSKVEEKVFCEGEEYFLSSNAYPGVIFPKGYQYLTSFQRVPLPVSVFSFKHSQITKSVFMRYGRNTMVVEYKNTGKKSLDLNLTPLLVHRDYHQLFHADPAWTFHTKTIGDKIIEVTPGNNSPPVFMRYTTGTFVTDPDWYRNFEYAWEIERGLDFHEDARCIGRIDCELKPGEKIYLVFSTSSEDMDGDPSRWKKEEEKRVTSLSFKGHGSFINDLAISGNQFIVQRPSTSSQSLIAGYHWFTDWGRDTMIAMRGLVIATGKKNIAKSILRTFLQYLDGGMIPNRFPDQGDEPEYNTIDASLWVFIALYEYHEQFSDTGFIDEVFTSLTTILESHKSGTRYNIHVTPEGLLYGGQSGTQLTWMDAKVGNHVVTPRIGCPVEINALWYNALSIYVHFGKILGKDTGTYANKVKEVKGVFKKYFLNDEGYLNDVVIPGGFIDNSIRPNQIYAVSLPFSPLALNEARKVMDVIREHLYTDFGLRSLSIHHPDFKPVYTGNQWLRDHAYHQGTVWGFLWGEYALAYMHVNKRSAASRSWVKDHAKAIENHFYHEDGLWAFSEIFDGGFPGPGKGCIQQAWSVGMTLKALLFAEKLPKTL